MPRREKKMTKKERKLARQQKDQERKYMLLLGNLEREISYGNVTRRKHEKSWRELALKIGLEKIRNDLEYTWYLFEWSLDIKDYAISALMDELDRVNKQYSLCSQNHNMVILRLLNAMNEQQKSTYEYFLRSLENIKQYYNQQHEQYEKKSEDEQNCMNAVIYRMSADHENYYRDRKARFFCQLESYTAAANAKESYEEISGQIMKKLWAKSTKVLNQRISTCEFFASAMLKDQVAEEISEITIKKNLKKILYFTEVLRKLQSKLTSLYETDGENLKQTTKLHEDFSMCLLVLKDKLFKDNKRDTRRTKLLICSAETIMDHFRFLISKGELILRLARLNRKYETSAEQVLPFPIKKGYWKRSFSKLDMTTVHDKLFLFYQKMAAVGASRMALNEEKKFLQLERTRLKKKFADFCGCFNCAAKLPRIKQENKHKTCGYSEKSDLKAIFCGNYQTEEDKATKKKFLEIRRYLDDAHEELKLIPPFTVKVIENGSFKNNV